ncbi:hypothetical protein MKX08_008152 [Trichoderma sp. CBMAI-0020]|nr:hypothetical protein MKX08_008152 [Trichoderma sp. CBMAI-0020]
MSTPATPTKFDSYKQKQGYEDATPGPYAPSHGDEKQTSRVAMLSGQTRKKRRAKINPPR